MSDVTDAIREKYPQYADVPEDQLVKAIGTKYPQYLKSSTAFAGDFFKNNSTGPSRLRDSDFTKSVPLASDQPPQLQDFSTAGVREAATGSVLEGIGLTPEGIQTAADYYTSKLPKAIQPFAKIGQIPEVAEAKTAAGFADWASSPKGAAQLVAAGIPVLRIPMAVKFFHDMAAGAGQSASDVIDKWHAGDYQGVADALAGTIANTLGAGAVGFHGVKSLPQDIAAIKGGESNAKGIRSNQGPSGEAGQVAQVSQNRGGQDLQQPSSGTREPVAEGETPPKTKVLLNPFKLEQDEDGKYVITNPAGEVVSEHATQQEAREAMDKLKVSGGRSTGTPLEQASAAAKAQGYELRAVPQAGAVKLEGLPEEQKAKLLAAQPPQWEFTNPKTGVTTYLPEGATPEQVTEHLKQKDKVVAAGDADHKAVVPALSPEDQAHIDAERGNVSAPVELVSETDTGNPFAQHVKGKIATIDRKNGRILINPTEFTEWLKDIPQAMKRKAVASLLSEEQIHLHTDDAAADAYWNTLTPREKLIVRRRYAGSQLALRGMNKTLWGHEALRFRMQQLTRMTPREIADAVGKEKWKLKALTVVETAIRGIRQTLGTKASKEATAILDKIQSNLDLAKTASKGANPAALSKKAKVMKFVADKLDEQAKMYTESGDAQSGLELKGMAEKLLQQYFDESFKEPAARRRKESDDQLKMGAIEAGDKFAGMKLAGAGNEAALSKAEKEMFDRAQAESGQKNFPGARPKKRHESIYQEGFILPGEQSLGGKTTYDPKTKEVFHAPATDLERKELPKVSDEERASANAALSARSTQRPSAAALGASASEHLSDLFKQRLDAAMRGEKVSLPNIKEFSSYMRGGIGVRDESGATIDLSGKTSSTLQSGQLADMWQSAVGKLVDDMPGEDMRLLAKGAFKDNPKEIKQAKYKELKKQAGNDPVELDRLIKEWQESLPREEGKRSIWDSPVPDKGFGDDIINHFTTLERELEQRKVEQSEREQELRDLTADSKTAIGPELADLEAKIETARTDAWDARKFVKDANRRIAELRPEYEGVKQKRKRRAWIQSALFRKMVRPPDVGRAEVSRKEVTPEDVRPASGGKYSSYEDLSRLPESKIAEALADKSRRSSSDSASITRRLAVLLNPRTGTVHLVSAYDKPHGPEVPNDVRVLDPLSPTREHLPLARILSRYKPLYSVFLDEPVSKFRQDFKNLKEYNSEFGKDAKSIVEHHAGYQPESLSEEEFMAESGGRISQGGGGSFQGPHRDLVSESEQGAAEAAERVAITPHEERSLVDYVNQFGRPASPDDVASALEKMSSIKPNAAVVSALRKISAGFQKYFPDYDQAQTIKALSRAIFDKTAKTGRGLPPAKDTPAAINRRKIQEGLAKEGEKISNDLGMLKNRTMATFVRQPTHKHLAATLDGAETLANNAARNSENAVRLPSADTKGITGFKKNFYGNQDILAAANAYYASGAIKTRYNYSLEAMDAADRILQSDEKAKAKNDYLGRIKKNAAIRTREGKDTPAMHQEVKDVQAELNKLVQNQLLESGHLTQEDATRYHDESAKPKLDEFMARVKLGDEKAKAMLERGGAWDRFRAKRWLKGNAKLMQELEFAKAHWEHPELRDTAMQIKKQLDTQFQLERSHGFNISYEENYLPGRYDGELFSGNGVLFGGLRLLGKQFRSAKVFPTYYHAAEAGPYIAATRDAASIVGSRVRQGLRSLNRTLWWNSLKGIEDEATGKMIATNGKEKNGRTVTPSPDYHEFHTPTGDKIYVLDGYEKLMHELTDPDALQSNTISRALLTTSQFLKHTVLLGDLFHLGRVGYYAASITGKNTFVRPGWAALDFREEDIPKAVERGLVAPQDAKWLLEKVAFTADGKPKMVSRMRLSKLFQKSGLNVGQIQDAISKDLVRHIPGFGAYNRFLFDRFTRGLMMNSALREFDRISKLEPGNDSRDILQRVSKDLNVYFGSIGRQGWIKSATFQSIARLTLLAPQWLEGLIKKEASPLRLLTSPKRGLTGHDTMLRGIGRGLLSMVVLTQVINLINRRQPTWQNPPGHKWDAEVGDNVWLSPLAVFNELTADLIRLNNTKPKFWDAIQQVGENKLGFWGRAGMVLATGKGASGQYKSTTAGLLGEAAKQFVPSPISFGPAARAIGNKIAPSLVSPNPPGKLTQSLYSSSGLKTHVGQTAESAIRQSAEAFNKAHGVTTPPIQYTDDPSYSQLRYLVKIGDLAGAQKMLKSLGKTPHQVMQDMRTWARRPFTGSKRSERLWVAGMTDEERASYTQAVNQKMNEFTNFENWYVKTQP